MTKKVVRAKSVQHKNKDKLLIVSAALDELLAQACDLSSPVDVVNWLDVQRMIYRDKQGEEFRALAEKRRDGRPDH